MARESPRGTELPMDSSTAAPGSVASAPGVQSLLLLARDGDVVREQRTEAIELIQPVNQSEDRIDRQCRLDAGQETLPQCASADVLHPQDKKEENASGDQVEAGGQPRQQVKAECKRADERSEEHTSELQS